jgi:catechol 2,3-dioxygenase-like lactoylglutathione lyase family enzyme
MLGRFLEVSIAAPDALESMQFYQRLGFTAAQVGDTWTHPYGVVTDGRLSIGLHQYEFQSPSLTFVKQDLGRHLEALERQGVAFEFRKLGENVFNEAGFRDPNGLMVTLLEARTFSPPAPECPESLCGYFHELGVPSRDLEQSRLFWERLGFVGMEATHEPFPRVSLTSDFVNVGLYDTRDLRQPVLAFVDADLPTRIARLAAAGIEPAPLPPGLDRNSAALFIAPEGTPLLLMNDSQ